MKNNKQACELCDSPATTYCESDRASLCWHCDSKVHKANFLVNKHIRTLLCHLCQSPTPWTASGPMLPPSLSFCVSCASTSSSRATAAPTQAQSAQQAQHQHQHHDHDVNDDDSYDDDEDDDDDSSSYMCDDDDDDEEDDNQVVPLTSDCSSVPSTVVGPTNSCSDCSSVPSTVVGPTNSCSSIIEAENDDDDDDDNMSMFPSSLKRKRGFYVVS